MQTHHLLLIFLICSSGGALAAQNATTPGAVVAEVPTCRSLGFKWQIGGDANGNCKVTVEYRRQGQTAWNQAMNMLRVEQITAVPVGNLLAGSILNLEPATTYDVRLVLTDADGGQSTQTLSATTRAIPSASTAGRTLYCAPGSGGGSGTQAAPYLGLAAAQSAAQPGDIILLQAGTYSGTFTVTKSGTLSAPIVYRGVNRDTVILDSTAANDQALVFSGVSHVFLESCTVIARKRRAIYSSVACDGVAVRKCKIDVTPIARSSEAQGIIFIGAPHKSLYVSENTVIGHEVWTQPRTDSFGISLTGQGHVVCYNEIYAWWDGLQIGANNSSVETSACDIYGNEFHECTDDAIEGDYQRHNVRIFENRFTNVHVAISGQPILGGPCYVWHNAAYNVMLKPLKLHINGALPNTWPSGLVCVGNTFINADPRGFGDGNLRNSIFRNNLFMGSAVTATSQPPIAFDITASSWDTDYNGWRQPGSTFCRLNGTSYAGISAFRSATQLELNGKVLDLTIFQNVTQPTTGGQSYPWPNGFPQGGAPGSQDLRLKSGSGAVDAGVALANLSDGFSGAGPDLGAYELGMTLPVYGPAGASAPNPTPGQLAIVTASLPNGVAGASYSRNVDATNGTGPFTWQVSVGVLPPGLVLAANTTVPSTTLSGTPTTPGNYAFTLLVVDSLGASDTQAYVVNVTPAASGVPPMPPAASGGGACVASDSAALAVIPVVIAMLLAARRPRARSGRAGA